MTPSRSRTTWTFVITSLAAFMVALDNLVVTTALPVIQDELGAGLEGLEWTVNAYTLPFAVLLLTGAALGDRFGRRRMFAVGMALFTLASASAALAPGIGTLVAARAAQGVGAAFVLPLTLTLLSAAVPAERRGAALGVWGAVSGLAVALGPLVGGAVTEGFAWQWIFWLNVPIGVALVPLATRYLTESRGPSTRLDPVGVGLVSAGLFGITFGIVRGEGHGWTSTHVLTSLVLGVIGVAAFVVWELRVARLGGQPMLPMSLFRSRAFAAVNVTAVLFSLGMFGAVFLLAQALQNVYGYSPYEAGLRTLPWTAMPLLIAPLAGPVSDRIGGRPLLVAGLSIQGVALAWLALIMSPTTSYGALVPAFVLAGIGMSLFFVPIATVALGSVRPEQQGLASGTNNAMRELGGVLGVAVLGSVFAARGGYSTPQTIVDGVTPALWVGVTGLFLGAAVALIIPRRRRVEAEPPVLADNVDFPAQPTPSGRGRTGGPRRRRGLPRPTRPTGESAARRWTVILPSRCDLASGDARSRRFTAPGRRQREQSGSGGAAATGADWTADWTGAR